MEQSRDPMDKNRIMRLSRPVTAKSMLSRAGAVNSAGVRRRRSNLPREVCGVSRNRD